MLFFFISDTLIAHQVLAHMVFYSISYDLQYISANSNLLDSNIPKIPEFGKNVGTGKLSVTGELHFHFHATRLITRL